VRILFKQDCLDKLRAVNMQGMLALKEDLVRKKRNNTNSRDSVVRKDGYQ
jgi:hypothetical protein